jgi:hypothetical protein
MVRSCSFYLHGHLHPQDNNGKLGKLLVAADDQQGLALEVVAVPLVEGC